MLLIQTHIGSSAIEGLGVFAAEPVSPGALVWTYEPEFDRVIPFEALLKAAAPLQAFLLRYAYFDHGLNGFLLDGDHARFLNHSQTPNIDFRADANGYAARFIAPGEEMTCDYRAFMDEAQVRHLLSPRDVSSQDPLAVYGHLYRPPAGAANGAGNAANV